MGQRGRFIDFAQKVQKVILSSNRQVALRAIMSKKSEKYRYTTERAMTALSGRN